MNIEIENNVATVTYKQNKRMTTKVISLDTLGTLFKVSEVLSSPILPVGCRNYSKSGNKHILCIEVLPARRQFRYKNSSGKDIVKGIMSMPRFLVFMTFIEEEKGFRFNSGLFKMFALADPLSSANAQLYVSPLPNSYNSGNVCWGNTFRDNNSALFIDDLSQAYRFIDIYFSGDFNTDLGVNFVTDNNIKRSEDLFRLMLKEPTFDRKYLMKTTAKMKDTIQYFANN